VIAGLLCYDLGAADLAGLAARYPLPTPFARLLQEIPAARGVAGKLGADLRPSQIDRLLRSLSAAMIGVLHYAETEPASKISARYLHTIRPARAPLDGRDMQRLGVAPGPMIGRVLDELRAAHLDGEVTTRAQAESWVRERLAERP
jgi:tRNA nucleotidyltransferase (CCA-adding enzyme)